MPERPSAAFTEAVGSQTDVWVLAQQAIHVLRRRFPQASVGYYEREGELWKARVWSSDLREDVEALDQRWPPDAHPHDHPDAEHWPGGVY